MTDTELETTTKEKELQLQLPLAADSKSSKVVHTFSSCAQHILALAVPLMLTEMTSCLQGIIAVYFAGQLNDVVLLDAISLGISWSGIFGFSIIYGVASAVNTLVSQSFGKKDYRMCGLTLNRALVIVSLAAIPCILFMLISRPVFLLVGINLAVSESAFYYTLSLVPAILMFIPSTTLGMFLSAQRIVKPQMVLQAVNMLLYPLYCYIFMFGLGMGYFGSAVARFVSQVVTTAGLVIYIKFSKCCEHTVVVPNFRELFSGWGEYLSIAIPGATMICLEWWAFEAINLLCGKLGVVELASNSISINFMCLEYVFCAGLGTATGTLVGNSLGEKDANKAKAYSFVGGMLTISAVAVLGTIIFSCRMWLARIFTTDVDVINMMRIVFVILVFNEIFDGAQGTLAKILIGMGRQARASVVNLIAYYALMIPVATLATLWLDLGIYGIWMGYLSGGMFVCAGYSWLIYSEDWDALVLEVAARGKKHDQDAEV